MTRSKLLILLVSVWVISGCQIPLGYQDVAKVSSHDSRLDTEDLQDITQTMVNKMLLSAEVRTIVNNHSPVLYIDRIQNQTSDHMDTTALTQTIKNQLKKTQKFQFINPVKLTQFHHYQQGQSPLNLIDPSTAIRFGKQIGAQYMLYGNLSNSNQGLSSSSKSDYTLILRLMDLNTGLIEWTGKQAIRKSTPGLIFGSD